MVLLILVMCGNLWPTHAAMDWEERLHPISVRAAHAMAYDSDRERIMLFGGSSNSTVPSETWEWDGVAWSLISPLTNSPDDNSQHGMCYMSSLKYTIFFGGVAWEGGSHNRTWVWDGMDWEQKYSENAPSKRNHHNMVYDIARDRVVMFGGKYGDDIYDDTWEWDGNDWEIIVPATTSPSPRYDHAMAYDTLRQKTVLFGGILENNTWEWDGYDWVIVEPATTYPPIGGKYALVYDSNRQRTVMFGMDWNWDSITCEWDGSDWYYTMPSHFPAARSSHDMAYDASNNVTILFGGSDIYGHALNDTWSYDGTDWTLIPPVHPSPQYRYNHRMVYDKSRNMTLLFGGIDDGDTYSDTWEWDGDDWCEIQPANHPMARYDFGLSHDMTRGVTVLFGGYNGSQYFRDTWEFDGGNWMKIPFEEPRPSGRWGHDMAYDSSRDRVILFGGYEGSYEFEWFVSDETWSWDGASWTLLNPLTRPPARFWLGMVYDSGRDRVVMFGGRSRHGGYNDTWEFDGLDWTQRTPATSRPPYRTRPGMVYDENRRRVVMFGGEDSVYPPHDDTWEWDGYDWYQITPAGDNPRPLGGPGMAYDSTRNRTVMFGGYGGYNGQETWEFFNPDPGVCETLGVILDMPAHYFRPGDPFYCNAVFCNNTGMTLTGYPLLVVLDVYGELFWGPEFTLEFDSYLLKNPSFPENETLVPIIEPFTWPSNAGSGTGIIMAAAVTDPDVTFLYGDLDYWEINWGE